MQERILVYGSAGSGKTYQWLKIAEHLPDVPFFCMDTDRSIARHLSTEFAHLGNVEVFPASDWDGCMQALRSVEDKTKGRFSDSWNDWARRPWFMVDHVCSTWEMVQSYFVEEIFNKDIGQYFLEVREVLSKGARRLDALDGWKDWIVINKIYQSWANRICALPCHVYLAARSAEVLKEGYEEPRVLDTYGYLGAKPAGEKRMDYRMHTVLYLTHRGDQWFTRTAGKDRGRAEFDITIHDLYMQYLVPRAGWPV